MDKTHLRKKAFEIRTAAHDMLGFGAVDAATGHGMQLLGDMDRNAVIALYSPVRGELDPRFLQQALEKAGFQTALPVVTDKDGPLSFRLWGQGDALIPGAYGILEPDTDAPEIAPHVVIAPLLAFDDECYRLGYGGGYYDRTLAADTSIKAFGFAFAAQLVDDLPREAHDFPMHGIITEAGVILPQKGRNHA